MVRNFDSSAGVSSKLIPKFRGPFQVSKVLDNDRYFVKDVEGFQRTQRPYEGIWAVQNMKPWFRGKDIELCDNDSFGQNMENNVDGRMEPEVDGNVLDGEVRRMSNVITRSMSGRGNDIKELDIINGGQAQTNKKGSGDPKTSGRPSCSR